MITKYLFTPISIKEYVRLHLKSNPGENKLSLEKRLQDALAMRFQEKNVPVVTIFG